MVDSRVTDVIDKGEDKGALLITEVNIKDKETGNLLCTLGGTTFARGDGGFGGPKEGGPKPHAIPDRDPDIISDLNTSPDQALLYRLSGDRNPLHSDPDVAEAAGFLNQYFMDCALTEQHVNQLFKMFVIMIVQ